MLTIIKITGLDFVAMNPSAWNVAVERVRQSLQGMVYNWRLISVIKPTSLTPRIKHLESELSLLPNTDTHQRQRLEAEILHLHDLQGRRMVHVDHFMIAWCPNKEAQQALVRSLAGSCGGSILQSQLPDALGHATYTAEPRTLTSTDGTHCWKGMLARSWSGELSPMLFRRILTHNLQAVIVIDVQTYTPEQARNKLDVALQRLDAHGYLHRAYDEERRLAKTDWKQASSHVQRGALLHRVHCAVFVHGDNEHQALSNAALVRQEISATIPLNTMIGQQHALAQLLTLKPIDAINLPSNPYPMVTPQVATVLPIYIHRSESTDPRALFMGIDIIRRQPLFINIEHFPSKNAFFSGATGSGKSAFAGTLGSRLMARGYQFIVLDPQAAFLPLAYAYREVASYNRISLDKRYGIQLNVLDAIITSLDDELLIQVTHVIDMMQWMHGSPFTSEQHMVLSDALTHLYLGLAGIDLSDTTAMPILSDLLFFIPRDDQTGIRTIIDQWTRMPYADFYNCQSTLDLRLDPKTPLIVYDVSDPKMPDRIKQFLMVMICIAIVRELRANPRDVILEIDEGGVLINNPLLARIFENVWKTIRRFRGNAWFTDQTLNVLDTKTGEEIFENSFITVLGSMKSDQGPALRARFPMLTDQHINWITGVGMSPEQRKQRAGHYVLIANDTPYMIYNDVSAFEWTLIPQKAISDQHYLDALIRPRDQDGVNTLIPDQENSNAFVR